MSEGLKQIKLTDDEIMLLKIALHHYRNKLANDVFSIPGIRSAEIVYQINRMGLAVDVPMKKLEALLECKN